MRRLATIIDRRVHHPPEITHTAHVRWQHADLNHMYGHTCPHAALHSVQQPMHDPSAMTCLSSTSLRSFLLVVSIWRGTNPAVNLRQESHVPIHWRPTLKDRFHFVHFSCYTLEQDSSDQISSMYLSNAGITLGANIHDIPKRRDDAETESE